jgi:hypothetical protein
VTATPLLTGSLAALDEFLEPAAQSNELFSIGFTNMIMIMMFELG